MKRKISLMALVLSVTALTANGKSAQLPAQSQKLASHNFYGTTVAFHSKMPVTSSNLTVVGPDGYNAFKVNKQGMVSIQLLDFGAVPDGKYNYRMVVNSGPRVRLKDNANNGRDPNKAYYGVKGQVQHGHFYVKYGSIKHFTQFKEPQR